mmetsp:Transcript_51183/g.61656  ORF Transcript_51183/g.61656 Transcript_51183/m.61656 type:complete len:516 (+) Transcript_51183:69-1616(+)
MYMWTPPVFLHCHTVSNTWTRFGRQIVNRFYPNRQVTSFGFHSSPASHTPNGRSLSSTIPVSFGARINSMTRVLSNPAWRSYEASIDSCKKLNNDSTSRSSIPVLNTFTSCDHNTVQLRDITNEQKTIENTPFTFPPPPLSAPTGPQTYQLRSPREWMEWIGVEGAYTVLRCERRRIPPKNNNSSSNTTSSSSSQWKVAGFDFHMKRLYTSYRRSIDDSAPASLQIAERQSRIVIDTLLSQYERTALSGSSSGVGDDSDNVDCRSIVMLTVLWTPRDDDKSGSGTGIRVRGHASVIAASPMSSSSSSIDYPAAVTAALALHPPLSTDDSRQQEDLPNRYSHDFESKLSSWCQRRRPIERAFKPSGISEVLLLRPCRRSPAGEDDYELLEGLTSNLFFVDDRGTVSTAPWGVLKGYVRDLIIECGETMTGKRWNVEERATLLSRLGKKKGGIKRVFATSSVRLIVPIERIVIVNEEGGVEREVWAQEALGGREEEEVWKELYREILERGVDEWLLQ